MKSFSKSVVAAGLVGALSLGMIGCSFSATTTTTLETTTTDENGNTSTTSQTSTVTTGNDGNAASTSGEGTLHFDYANPYYMVAFNMPEGFTKKDGEQAPEGASTEFCATDGKSSMVYIAVTTNITNFKGVTDEASWAKVIAEQQEATYKESGETDIKSSIEPGKVGQEVPVTMVKFESQKDGKTLYREYILRVGEDNTAISFYFESDDPKVMEELNSKVASLIPNSAS